MDELQIIYLTVQLLDAIAMHDDARRIDIERTLQKYAKDHVVAYEGWIGFLQEQHFQRRANSKALKNGN